MSTASPVPTRSFRQDVHHLLIPDHGVIGTLGLPAYLSREQIAVVWQQLDLIRTLLETRAEVMEGGSAEPQGTKTESTSP